MVEIKYDIFEIDPDTLLELDVISDENLKNYLEEVTIPSTFIPNEDFIELSYYTLDNTKLLSLSNYTNYSVLTGDSKTSVKGNSEISIDPLEDYKAYYNDSSEVKALYHFLRNPFKIQGTNSTFSLESISPDRRELRLIPVSLGAIDVGVLANRLENRLENSTYNLDIHLYSSVNEFYPIVNIGTREFRGTTALVVKLAEPLQSSTKVYSTFSVVEKISNSLAYEINTTLIEEEPPIPTLRGANFNIGVEEQTAEPSEYFNYNELFSFPNGNSNRELNSLFNEKGAELGIDYSEFSNFINFSSIEERLRNFKYKVDLLESYQSNLDIINNTGATYNSSGVSGSRDYYENLLNGVVNNFDHYERSLYYESGSNSWPKSNDEKPYINQPSDTTEATLWYTTKLQDAVLYDAQNANILTNTIPSYLKEDESNDPYNLFINMIGQHFDNLWTYTDAVSKKYDADNRLNRGVSKDLVEELLKNFGLKLYTSNKSAEDLFKYFIANSYEVTDEVLTSGITTSGEQALSQNDYQKEIYKRIYHNLPILLKSKGTERGLRALINCFGIPSDILKIKIYGGQSVEELPYFAGEQAWTGSIDKVRLDNTGSIVEGSTLSYYTEITRGDNKYTQDLHRIEVGFSPSDNMNSYIVSQSAVLFPNDTFNIDNYIGDPRGYKSNIYPDLFKYSKIIFENVDSYNLKDFVRLIKFFDNVIFRMVKDFVPARTVTDSGIIIKPHLLERYHTKSPVMTWTMPEYSGSIDTAFISGSNTGTYANIGANSIPGQSGKESSTSDILFHQSIQTPEGKKFRNVNQQQEPKFNGELYNSKIKVTDGELNRDNPFKNLEYDKIEYNVILYRDPPPNVCALPDENLGILILDPQDPNLQSYNLGLLFGVPNLNFIVEEGGVTSTVNHPDFLFDFSSNGTSQQYDEFIVTANHLTLPGCSSVRVVKLVGCDLQLNSNAPSVISVGSHDLTDFISQGSNTDLIYTIETSQGIVTVDNPTEYYIEENDFENGDTLVLKVQDENNPECFITKNIEFNNCTLQQQGSYYPIVGQEESSYYESPYSFTNETDSTQYYFQLQWDSTGWPTNQTRPPFEADRFSIWQPIGYTSVSAHSIAILINGYPEANAVDTYTGTPPSTALDQFLKIENLVANPLPGTEYHKVRIKFKAKNSDTCEEVGDKYGFFTGAETQDDYYGPLNVLYSISEWMSCCQSPSTSPRTVIIPNNISLTHLYENGNGSIPSEPLYKVAYDQNGNAVPGNLADTGYYSDGMSIAYFQNSGGGQHFWGPIYMCGNMPGPQQDQCF